MKGAEDSRLPLSRPVPVADLAAGQKRFHVTADAGERAALARELDILGIDRLEADVVLRRLDDAASAVRLSGTVESEVEQACVVTLEPVRDMISAEFNRNYAAEAAEDAVGDIEITPESEEPPEPIIDGVIDIGVAVAEQLALELDPFPRREGVAFEGYSTEARAGGTAHPFAALAALKRKGRQ